MTCCDVSEETHCQDERLDKTAHHLDEWHQWQWKLQPPRHTWSIEDIFVIMFRSSEIRDDESKQSKYCSHSDVSRDICSEWEKRYQSQDVIEKYEEKHRQKIREIFLVMFAYIRFRDVVTHIKYDWLY